MLINDPLNHQDEPDRLLRYGDDLGTESVELPAIHIKRDVAAKLFEKAGTDLLQVQKDIDEGLEPVSFELTDSNVRMSLEVSRTSVTVRNVLGYLPPAEPNEPTSNDELLIIGAHYDHVGFGERNSKAVVKGEGQIHNGADDNASGTAGVIELARVFATRNDLNRGILFLAFAAEELGLLGSSYYTQNPTIPLEKTVAMLNLDMIGRLRDDKLYIGGVGSSPVFRTKLEEIGEAAGVSFIYNFSGYGSSDHTSFNRIEIPALFFFTGLHGDYHRPSDDWQEINTVGGERVLRIAYQMADYLQSLPERPTFSRSAGVDQRRQGETGPIVTGRWLLN
jgi:Zn-dependent M28 family amino/carboxypeptidase